jgi:hypothetical protein
VHQVILRQCHIYVPTLSSQNRNPWQAQIEHSEAQIRYFSIEIAATVPQLAGYHQQLEHRRLANPSLTVRVTKGSGMQPANLPRCDPKIAISGDEPSPLGKGIPPAKKPSEVSVFYADCNDGELQINTPASKTRPGAGPEPASIYHMLFQLYTLRSISSLSNSFRAWIQGRITWMENMTNDEDLTLLQNMVTDRPGDGYPIGEGG